MPKKLEGQEVPFVAVFRGPSRDSEELGKVGFGTFTCQRSAALLSSTGATAMHVLLVITG